MATGHRRHTRTTVCRMSLLATAIVYSVVTGAACAPRKASGHPTTSTHQAEPVTKPHAEVAPPVPVLPGNTPGASGLQPGTDASNVDPAALRRLIERNLAPTVSLPETLLANRLAAWRALPVGVRIARWAMLFAERNDNVYLFGPKPGGYVGDSLLVQDHKFDCVLLFYRCTELARAASPRDAIVLALTTRFAGGDPAHVVHPNGAVDYHDPAHLDYSEDFAATGIWGRDVTREVGDAVADSAGTNRYAGGTRFYIPKRRLAGARFQEGDLLFLVLDEDNEGARKLRQQYGLLIGHQAIVHIENGTVYMLHAAVADLQGVYTGNRVVQVPLATYLDRVEKFKGVMVSRIESDAVTPARP